MDSITDKIWIGNYLDASDVGALANAGIRSILCLDGCMADRRVKMKNNQFDEPAVRQQGTRASAGRSAATERSVTFTVK